MSTHRTEDVIEEHVQIDPSQPVEITIENQNGDVSVRGVDRADVLIRAEKHGDRGSAVYQEAELLIKTDDARIVVRPVVPPHERSGPSVTVDLGLDVGLGFLRDFLDPASPDDARRQRREERGERRRRGFAVTWPGGDVSYEIEVEVPKTIVSNLTVKTASGDVDLTDLTGTVELNSASGDTTAKRLTGTLDVNTASGDLRAHACAGQFVVRTASGDARIERSAFRSFGFHTAGGDLNLDAVLTGEGPFAIETVSGDAQLAVLALDPVSGAERRLELAFHSMSGTARLDREFERLGNGHWATPGAQPGPSLGVRTVSGDLRASLGASADARERARQPVTPAATAPASGSPAPPTPPAVVVPPAPPAAVVPPAPVPAPSSDDEAAAAADPVHTGERPAGEPSPAYEAERLALLEAVERGEIDIEEALRRLEDRDDQPLPSS